MASSIYICGEGAKLLHNEIWNEIKNRKIKMIAGNNAIVIAKEQQERRKNISRLA